jgi:hypothetical protein
MREAAKGGCGISEAEVKPRESEDGVVMALALALVILAERGGATAWLMATESQYRPWTGVCNQILAIGSPQSRGSPNAS